MNDDRSFSDMPAGNGLCSAYLDLLVRIQSNNLAVIVPYFDAEGSPSVHVQPISSEISPNVSRREFSKELINGCHVAYRNIRND